MLRRIWPVKRAGRTARGDRLDLRVVLRAELRQHEQRIIRTQLVAGTSRPAAVTERHWPDTLSFTIVADIGRSGAAERWTPTLLSGSLYFGPLQALYTYGCVITYDYALTEADRARLADRLIALLHRLDAAGWAAECLLRPLEEARASSRQHGLSLDQVGGLPPELALWKRLTVEMQILRGWAWRFRHIEVCRPGVTETDLLATTFVEVGARGPT